MPRVSSQGPDQIETQRKFLLSTKLLNWHKRICSLSSFPPHPPLRPNGYIAKHAKHSNKSHKIMGLNADRTQRKEAL